MGDKDSKDFGNYLTHLSHGFKFDCIKKFSLFKAKYNEQFELKLQNLRMRGEKLRQEQTEEIKNYQEVIKQTDLQIERCEDLLSRSVELTRLNLLKKATFAHWKNLVKRKKKRVKRDVFVEEFKGRGLLRRSIKAWKMFARILGKEAYTLNLDVKLKNFEQNSHQEKSGEINMLTEILNNLKEQIAIEAKKKGIIKSQLDQAFLRGASAVSFEALHMSQSTLMEHYNEMKDPNMLLKSNIRSDDPSMLMESRDTNFGVSFGPPTTNIQS